ncbi:MAG: hypothetical protein HYX82_01485 [Chloroflexi bacterium]|nr:hypothetical protein [Chloroflexota bacterium]
MEIERQLTVEELRRLDERRARSTQAPVKHAFWAGPMPDPNVRPPYHETIKRLYDDFLDPHLKYVDAYHLIMSGSPVFNETIQNILIKNAEYIVADLSLPRHDVIFETGFGLGAGIQTILYIDVKSSIRRSYPGDVLKFTKFDDIKKQLPPQMQDCLFVQPPRRVPEGVKATKRGALQELAMGFNENVHTPGLQITRRRCCKIHFEDRECEFVKELVKLSRPRSGYCLVGFQDDHEEQKERAINIFKRRGFKFVEELDDVVENEAPLCRTCFFLRVANRIIVDGTSAEVYNEESAESAFVLGMAVAIKAKYEKSTKIKMLFDERVGPIGMFAGGRAGWQSERWRDQIDRELQDW